MKINTLVYAVAVAAFVMLFTGTLSAADKTSTEQVQIQNFSFIPETVTVHPGTKVVWTNKDPTAHTVTSVDKKFHSRNLKTGQQFAFTFKKPGTYNYICSIHPYMKGKIVVEK